MDEAVKVEVWDVVDRGIAAGEGAEGDLDKIAGLPTTKQFSSNSGGGALAFGKLDASVVDVYQGAQAAIFMVCTL